MSNNAPTYMSFLAGIAKNDVANLEIKDKSYGGSWKKRGGVGAFMMLARKWDRIENQVQQRSYDIFKQLEAERANVPHDGLIDDIRDLRRYLMLIEAEMLAQAVVTLDAVPPLMAVKPGLDPINVLCGSVRGYDEKAEERRVSVERRTGLGPVTNGFNRARDRRDADRG